MKRSLSLLLCAIYLLKPISFTTHAISINNTFIVREAENYDEMNSGFELIEDSDASGGFALRAEVAYKANEVINPPALSYSINIPKRGRYSLYVRTLATSSTSSRIMYSFDGEKFIGLALNIDEKYTWQRVTRILLPEGEQKLFFHYGKKDLKFDKFILTDNPTFTPNDIGDNEPLNGDEIFESIDNNENKPMYRSIPLPPYIPPKEHPRVLVRKDDIEKIKSNLFHKQNIDAYKKVLEKANLDPSVCNLPPVNDMVSINYNITGLQYIESNAFLYLLYKDEVNGRKAIDGMLNFLRTLDMTNHDNLVFQSRNGGFTVVIASEVYDWCYDLLTEEEKREIILLVLNLMTEFEFSWPPFGNRHPIFTGHESEGDFIRNLLSFGIAIYDEYPEVYNIVAGTIFNDFIPTKNYLYTGNYLNVIGFFYGNTRFFWETYLAALLDKIGCGSLITREQRMHLYGFIYGRLPTGGYFRNGDDQTYQVKFDPLVAPHAFMAANMYKDPYIKQEFYRASEGAGNSEWHMKKITPVNHLILNDVSVESRSLRELPLSMYMGPQTGAMIARTGWDEGVNSNDMVVFMKTPEKFFGGHSHFDAGQFQIYYKGMLALKSGIYGATAANATSDHAYGYAKQTVSSNCMLIYNPNNDVNLKGKGLYLHGGQSNAIALSGTKTLEEFIDAPPVGKVLGYDYGEDMHTPSYTYLKGDITGAYNGNADLYTRGFVFLNFFDEIYPGALIVFDKVKADPRFKKTWLLHSEEEPSIEGNLSRIEMTAENSNGRLINETLLPKLENAKIEKVGGKGKEFLVGTTNFPPSADDGSIIGKWRIELSAKEESNEDYYLNVMQASDLTLNPEPLKSELYESKDYVGIKIKDCVVFLSKKEERTSNDILIKSEGETNEELIYMIDNLKEGTWNIYKDGNLIASKSVSKEGGTVSFNGTAGEYLLKYFSKSYTPKSYNILDYIRPLDNKEIYLRVNGNYYNFNSPVIYKNDDIFVPIKDFTKLFGGRYITENNNQKIIQYGSETFNALGKIEEIDKKDYIRFSQIADFFKLNYSFIDFTKILDIVSLTRVDPERIVNSQDERRIKVIGAVSNGGDVIRTIDENPATVWTANGEIFITYEFENEENVSQILIKWNNPLGRNYFYEIHASSDGITFNKIFDGSTSGETEDKESSNINPTKAKYIKFILKGNSQNNTNGIYQVEFYK